MPLRLLVRDPSRAPSTRARTSGGIGGYGAADEIRAALEGVDTLFLVPAEESADRVEQHRTAIEAAVAAGVRRIVYLSFVGAAPDATFTLVRDHWATEEIVRATGLAHTFPRMNLYMDFLPAMVAPTARSAGRRATGGPRRSCARTSPRGSRRSSRPRGTTAASTTSRARRPSAWPRRRRC